MSIKTKIAAVALAAVTVAATFSVSSSEAEARGRWGAVVGAGIATGLILGAAAASSPTYAYSHRRCGWVRNYNAYGHYVGKSRVCSYY